jgi:hypothetical protein
MIKGVVMNEIKEDKYAIEPPVLLVTSILITNSLTSLSLERLNN